MTDLAAASPSNAAAPSHLDRLAERLRAGERRALARAITLVESERADHQAEASRLLTTLMTQTGDAVRLGISGVPGAGKSTFIEALGARLIEQGERVAVLAVDPSSKRSGGSILGDKTRMELLSRDPRAFIRPSPAGVSLGGVARRTRESALLCEAAGFSVVIIETVGVGQSEMAVADMVDTFLLLLSPGGGDELQGIKRGIVEIADVVLINKADGDLLPAAKLAQQEYQNALHLLRPSSVHWTPKVLTCSALKRDGVDEVWHSVQAHRRTMMEHDVLDAKRAEQLRAWLWTELHEGLRQRLRAAPHAAERLRTVERAVGDGTLSPPQGAARVLDALFGATGDAPRD